MCRIWKKRSYLIWEKNSSISIITSTFAFGTEEVVFCHVSSSSCPISSWIVCLGHSLCLLCGFWLQWLVCWAAASSERWYFITSFMHTIHVFSVLSQLLRFKAFLLCSPCFPGRFTRPCFLFPGDRLPINWRWMSSGENSGRLRRKPCPLPFLRFSRQVDVYGVCDVRQCTQSQKILPPCDASYYPASCGGHFPSSISLRIKGPALVKQHVPCHDELDVKMLSTSWILVSWKLRYSLRGNEFWERGLL